MVISDGTYEILWADNPNYALDSYGAEDKTYVMVVLHPRNQTDAQFLQVSEPNVWFPLTGMSLSVNMLGMSDIPEGGFVIQETPRSLDRQEWEFVDTGSTKKIKGASYPIYDLRLKAWPDKVVGTTETPGSGTGPNNTARVTMHTPTYSGFKHGFCLVETKVLPMGTYEFRPYASEDETRIDVSSDAQGAYLREWPVADNSRGVWVISENEDDGTQKISNSKNGKVMDVNQAIPTSGQKVIQHTWNSNANQRWLIVPYGSGKVNGLVFPLYKVRSKLGTNLILDVTEAYSGDTSVSVRTEDSSSTNQLFHMFPTETYASNLQIPSSLHPIYNGRVYGSSKIQANGQVTFAPSWGSLGTEFQMRYRLWSRDCDASDLVSTEWRDIQSESGSNDGWGIIWEPNVVSNDNPRRAKEITLELSLTEVDRYDFEYEVRRFASNWRESGAAAHGGSASERIVLCWNPTVTLSDLTFSPEGIKLSISSDLKRDGNSATITINGVVDSHVENSINSDETIEIPLKELKSVPEDGQTVIVSVRYTTADGAQVTKNEVMNVSYSTGHGMSFNPKVTIDEDAIGHCVAPTGTKLWLVIHRGHGDKLLEIEDLSNFLPPLGVEYRLFASLESGDNWGTWSKVFDPIKETPALYRWNWGSDYSGKATLAWNEGDSGPDFEPSYTADVTKYTTTGRERNVATFGSTVASSLNVSGVLVDFYETPDGDYDAMDALAHCKQAVFRSPRGMWATVAVEGLSINAGGKGVYSVSVTQSEVSW